MRIALIDHSFRQTTKSVEFLYEILRSVGSLSLFYDESWRGGPNAWRTTFDESDYDLVVIVQAHWAFDFLSGKHQNVVFIPMYDAMFSESGFVWKSEFSNAKCVSFSRKLHQEIANRNGLSGYFKYFPDPSQFGVVSDFDQIRPFFWYRRSDITPDYVLELCRETDLRTLTLHNAPDPKQPPLWLSKLPPNLSDIKITTWWKDTADYRNALHEHNIFFAPRISEGIGASFIELHPRQGTRGTRPRDGRARICRLAASGPGADRLPVYTEKPALRIERPARNGTTAAATTGESDARNPLGCERRQPESVRRYGVLERGRGSAAHN
jgi:hypothetical protein